MLPEREAAAGEIKLFCLFELTTWIQTTTNKITQKSAVLIMTGGHCDGEQECVIKFENNYQSAPIMSTFPGH